MRSDLKLTQTADSGLPRATRIKAHLGMGLLIVAFVTLLGVGTSSNVRLLDLSARMSPAFEVVPGNMVVTGDEPSSDGHAAWADGHPAWAG